MPHLKIYDSDQGKFVRPAAIRSDGVNDDPVLIEDGSGGFVVVYNQSPSASFTVSESDTTVDVDATDSNDVDGTIQSFDWDFGDGTTGTGVTASHTYDSTGNYTITLTVTDDFGATGSTTADVTIGAAVLEDWESSGLTRYTGEKSWTQSDGTPGGFEVVDTNPVGAGRALHAFNAQWGGNAGEGYHTIVTLDETTQQGESYAVEVYYPTTETYTSVLFGVQSTDFPFPCYRWRFDTGGSPTFDLERVDADGSIKSHELTSDQVLYSFESRTSGKSEPPAGYVYRLEWTWTTDGNFPFTVYQDGAEWLSSTDPEGAPDQDQTYTSGGIGWMHSASGNDEAVESYYDNYLRT